MIRHKWWCQFKCFVTMKDAYKHLLLQKRWCCCSCSEDCKRIKPNGQNLQILSCYRFLALKSVESCWLVFMCSSLFLWCDKEILLWNNEKASPRNVIKDSILKYLHYNKAKSFFGVHMVIVSVGQVSKPLLKDHWRKSNEVILLIILYFDGILDHQSHARPPMWLVQDK